MSSLLIRPAVLKDAKAVAEIYTAATRPAAAGGEPSVPAGGSGPDRQQVFWREAIEFGEPQMLVASEGDAVVGFVGFDRSRDAGTAPTMGEIWSIYVRDGFLGKGIGLALWDAAREGLQEEGCTEVSVWVPLGNDRALRFHELAGFKKVMSSARTTPVGGVRIEEIRLKRKL